MDESFPVRVGANAVVVSDDHVLAVKFDDETGPHYNLPGGGVETGERVPDALRREVREETTADVEVGDLAFVHEYYPPDHDEEYGSIHKLTLFFECELVEGASPALPQEPDPHQVGVEWLPVEGIRDRPLLPDLGHWWRAVFDADHPRRFLDSPRVADRR